MSETAALLGWSVDQACEGLFAPVGLDLGGDGAEAIALAVIAEIQACVEGKLGTFAADDSGDGGGADCAGRRVAVSAGAVCAVSAGRSVAAVVLAAGASRRLGRPKQMVEMGGETLLERAVRVAVEAGLEPVCGGGAG